MKKIVIALLLCSIASQLCGDPNKIRKPIGNSYLIYPECVEEANESFHPLYYLSESVDYRMNALDLLVWWRFDIIAKYIFGLHRELQVRSDWAKDLYLAHQRVWSNCYEADGSKQNCGAFLSAFKKTLHSIKTKGFDPQKGKIKIDISKYPCDGSHRIASCILFNKPIVCYHSSEKKHCTYSSAAFFKYYTKFVHAGLDNKYLDAMALEYCKLKKNTRIIVVPFGKDISLIKKTIRSYGVIVYEKEFSLTKQGIKNLFELLPQQTQSKTTNNSKETLFKIFVCEFDIPDSQIPKAISSSFNPSDAHIITTDHKATIELTQMLLLDTTINFLNHRKSAVMNSLQSLLSTLEKIIAKNGLSKDHLCIFEPCIQAAYGIKDCDHLAVALHSKKQIPRSEIDKVLINATHQFDDIIFNPTHHFYYKGFKFAVPQK
jgi:hypothetical protein